ncbi:hypothetical protein [Nocardioides sp. MH1]|uniref:hypothetical protein n=1 Tax=Nocardioides sp. MH1 TaxID=3242490 RepID=UPI003520B793
MSTDRSDEESQERVKVEGDEVHAPEGKFPADAKGFDGTPVEQILKERDERLDPDNRPENTEVSNAGREFNVAKGMFTDEPGFDEAEEQFTAEDP